MFYSFVTLPTTSVLLADIKDVSSPVFQYLFPAAVLLIGFIIAGLIINFVIRASLKGVGKVFGTGRKKRVVKK